MKSHASSVEIILLLRHSHLHLHYQIPQNNDDIPIVVQFCCPTIGISLLFGGIFSISPSSLLLVLPALCWAYWWIVTWALFQMWLAGHAIPLNRFTLVSACTCAWQNVFFKLSGFLHQWKGQRTSLTSPRESRAVYYAAHSHWQKKHLLFCLELETFYSVYSLSKKMSNSSRINDIW